VRLVLFEFLPGDRERDRRSDIQEFNKAASARCGLPGIAAKSEKMKKPAPRDRVFHSSHDMLIRK
jgi:hypothetical protein